jgi:resolvase, n-terminal:recombinase, putative
MSRVEHGTEYCKKSITLDEEKLQKAICRALKTAVQDRKEVMDLIMSNLSYAVTGENDVLDTYAIERQMETIKGEIDDSIELLEKTEGDKGRIEQMIEQQTNALAALREQVKLVRAKIESNETVHTEIERIKKLLTDEPLCFDIYDDKTVRMLVEYIRVQEDESIVIMLKGGITIEEKVL